MDKIEYRSVIKFLTKENESAKNIHERMAKVYGDECPSMATVYRWHSEFKRGRDSAEDDVRSGRPTTSTTDENADTVHDLIMTDRRLTIEMMAEILDISFGSVWTIIHEHLDMRKVCAQWVPKILRKAEMNSRVELAKQFLSKFKTSWDQIRRRLVTCDETWIYHDEPHTRQSGMEWRKRGEKGPKKPKVRENRGKLMATFFWDCRGVIMIDYLPRGQTMNGDYYADLMRQLREQIKKKRRGMLAKGVLLLQDNARVHTCNVSKSAIEECGYELIPHPAYSPDLAPSDYHLFSNLKREKCGTKFTDDNGVQQWIQNWIDSQTEEFFAAGIDGLLPRLEECIRLRGDYLEK